MNKTIYSPLAIGIVILLSLFFGGIIWFSTADWGQSTGNIYERPGEQKNQKEAAKVGQDFKSIDCNDDIKPCEGGTSVGRIAPDCEFAACPGEAGAIVGGDKDEHGCIGSAGYSWCEEKQKCLRGWEESCSL